jgi:hypothetical protein
MTTICTRVEIIVDSTKYYVLRTTFFEKVFPSLAVCSMLLLLASSFSSVLVPLSSQPCYKQGTDDAGTRRRDSRDGSRRIVMVEGT